MKKYYLISLGCPKNLVDSEVFAQILHQVEYKPTPEISKANLILINTCGFIEPAKQESIDTIMDIVDLKKENPHVKLAVTGCLVKRYRKEIQEAIPEIDYLIDLKDFSRFARIFNSEPTKNRFILTPDHYAYLRISDGCDNHCSYCTIPFIRGKLKSERMDSLTQEAVKLAKIGVKELIITAQDTTQYGVDIYGQTRLISLLKELDKIEGLEWIRLLYLHPAHINKELIAALKDFKKLLPYFDIPIQHINDRILYRMNRKIKAKKIRSIFKEIRNILPMAEFRTSVMVGFPGETESEFEQLLDYLIEEKFLRLGVFSYSRERSTTAAKFSNQIQPEIALQRMDILMSLQQDISKEKMETFVGQKMKLIIDQPSDNKDFKFIARSIYDAPEIDGIVYLKTVIESVKIGDIIEAEIIDSWEYDLVAELK